MTVYKIWDTMFDRYYGTFFATLEEAEKLVDQLNKTDLWCYVETRFIIEEHQI